MSQALRKLAGTLNRTDTICLFTNQLREKIGVMFGNPETTPGGRALKFYSSVRLDIRRIETLKDGVEAVGNRTRVKVVKNKGAPPFNEAEFDIMYGTGFSWEGTVIDVATERKVVTKSGSYFSFRDERLGQGRQNATAFLREHPDVTQQILQQIQIEIRAGADRVRTAAAARRGDTGRRWVGRRRRRQCRRGQRRAGEQGCAGRGCGGRCRQVGAAEARRRQPAARDRHRAARAAAGRVAVELDGRPWRVLPTDAVVRAGSRSGGRSTATRRVSSRARFAVRARSQATRTLATSDSRRASSSSGSHTPGMALPRERTRSRP